jgi:hypothetical protein
MPQIEGDGPEKKRYSRPPVWGMGLRLTSPIKMFVEKALKTRGLIPLRTEMQEEEENDDDDDDDDDYGEVMKIEKSTINFVMYVSLSSCLSVCPSRVRLDGFS